jgi:aspartate kinase
MRLIVMKFGGTSLADAERMRQVGAIVRRFSTNRLVVVVSALAGVTDALLACAADAAAGRAAAVRRGLARLRSRHLGVAASLRPARGAAADLGSDLETELDELGGILHGVLLLREPGGRSLDLVASFGERLSARLVAGHLRGLGLDAVDVDARGLVVTDDGHQEAAVDVATTRRRARAGLLRLLRAGRLPVVTGFIASSREGATTTLGRSGSDYTAALLGEALGAREVWIWKEVDGVCTADPGLVPGARLVPRLSYMEAAEMAHFGAEVIHPKTMQPARRAGIPIRIKNTFRPEGAGTVITARAAPGRAPLMVSCLDGLALVTIEGTGIFGQPGMVLRLLSPVAAAGTNIYMISMSSSEYSISFAIRASDVGRTIRALEHDFRAQGLLGEQVARVKVERGMAIVAVVGARMKGQRGIAGRIFSALGESGVNVVAIAQGSSEYNITIVVRGTALRAAVRAVHDRLVGRGKRR